MPFNYKIYFTERPKNRVIRWDPDSGDAEVELGEPSDNAPDQKLNDPYGLAVDPSGALVIADKLGNRICKSQNRRLSSLRLLDSDGTRQELGRAHTLFSPAGLFTESDGGLLAGFSDDYTIYRIERDGRLKLLLGIPAFNHYLIRMCHQTVLEKDVGRTPVYGPTAIVRHRNGDYFFIERGYQVVRRYRAGAGLECLFPLSLWSKGVVSNDGITLDGSFDQYHPSYPSSLALDATGHLYLTDVVQGCILRLDLQNKTLRCVLMISKSKSLEGGPSAVTFSPDGVAWVMNSVDGTVSAYDTSGKGTWKPMGLVLKTVQGQPLRFYPAGAGIVCATN